MCACKEFAKVRQSPPNILSAKFTFCTGYGGMSITFVLGDFDIGNSDPNPEAECFRSGAVYLGTQSERYGEGSRMWVGVLCVS